MRTPKRPAAIPLSRPAIPRAALADLEAILASGMLVEGERCAGFASALADYAGARHCVLVNSGTTALYLSLLALGIGPGDVVIVPAYSFPATANAVAWLGAEPAFADIDPATWNVTAATVAAAADALPARKRGAVRAVMPVQAFGNPVDMPPLLQLARERGWAVVEDAACALGSRLDGRMCGAHGKLGCYSFHPRKILTTGEGGAILTGDPKLARRLALLKNHGMERVPGRPAMRFGALGLNFRFTELAAALGLAQLRELERALAWRRAQAAGYRRALEPLGAVFQEAHAGGDPNWQSLVARFPFRSGAARDRFIAGLAARNIQATIGTYFIPATEYHRRRLGPSAGRSWPEARALHREAVCLPLHAGLGPEEVERVRAAVRDLGGRWM